TYTRTYHPLTLDHVADASLIVYANSSTEERARLPVWEEARRHYPGKCILVMDQHLEHIVVQQDSEVKTMSLRDQQSMANLVAADELLLDISGLAHHVWAPLLLAANEVANCIRVVYAEPESYRAHPSPASPTLFDLSIGF